MMYTVHMKQVAATQARKSFFNLLDTALAGEKVFIKRHDSLIDLVPKKIKKLKKHPDYTKFFHSSVDEADLWSWDWHPDSGLQSVERKK